MRQKFWFLVSSSFQKKAKSKWFLVANILLLVAVVAVFNIDQIISYFGGDFSEEREVIIVDQTDYAYSLFQTHLEQAKALFGMDYTMKITQSYDSVDSLKKEIQDTKKIVLVFEEDAVEYLKVSMISSSYIDTSFYQYLYQTLNSVKTSLALARSGIDLDVYAKVTSPLQIERVLLDKEKNSEEEMMNTVMGTVFPTLILPFFILVIFLVQMIGMEINEEKSSRCMEIIISNVSPKLHFFSKIVAGNAFVLLQALLLVLYSGLGLLIRNLLGFSSLTGEIGTYFNGVMTTLSNSGILNQLVYIIPIVILFIVLSFLAYSLVAGILASMTVNMEDFQQVQTPIMFICMIGYYLSIMSSMFQGSVFIRVLSYVPFLSSLLSPALLITGQIQIIDAIISIVILIFFNYFLIHFGLKIYKIGILNYSTDKMWRRIFRAVKEKD